MKIAVLSRNSHLYSTRRLVEAIRESGHEARVIDHLKCDLTIESTGPKVYYHGESLED
ncbi:MAG TPA: 30S ribosomal protein S6--L-glutamate ligase, partial [Roseivirga sp.]